MCTLPIEILVGPAPVLQRTLTTGTVMSRGAPSRRLQFVAPHVGRQVVRSVEAAAIAALHCPVCQGWLEDGDPVRDFLLQQCVEALCCNLKLKSPPRQEAAPPLKRVRSELQIAATNRHELSCSEEDHDRLFCSVCLERFPEPHCSPELLHCGHALCRSCVGRLRKRGKQCPLCKVAMVAPERPSSALRAAFRFLNALPIAQGVQDLASCEEDLREVHLAVLQYRREKATALATPLHQAIQRGDATQVAALLAEGCDCNVLVAGYAALHVAVVYRRFDFVQTLLDHKADPACASSASQETPLLMASCADHGRMSSDPARLQAVTTMVSHMDADSARACVRRASAPGATALHRIAQRLVDVECGLFSGNSFDEEMALARLLVAKGADIGARDVFGQSPADIVKKVKRGDVHQLFLTRVEDLGAVCEGRSACNHAASD